MNARYYDATLGRFLGQDSVFLDITNEKKIEETTKTPYLEYLSNPQASNSYSYVLNNPLKYKDVILDIPVKIIDDPFEVVEDIFKNGVKHQVVKDKTEERVFLPLYSLRGGKIVPVSSGLNQWNAKGRPRHPNEVYIPIPSWIHKVYPKFFPPRDKPFNLHIPNGKILSAKVCQDNSKALMTNPNQELGEWLLRGVLNLREGELLTYKKLERIGLDSVMVYKISPGEYGIDFTKAGSFEDFASKNKEPEQGVEVGELE